MSEQEVITELAKKYLNETGQADIEERLANNKLAIAKLYLLGAIDSLWHKGMIGEDEASKAYLMLGIKPADASRVRQASHRW